MVAATMTSRLLSLAVLLALGVACSSASRMFILDDGDFSEHVRTRRDAPPPPLVRPLSPLEYDPIPPVRVSDLEPAGSDSYHSKGYYRPGKVGPVYTFVKTDPYAHVKWGVRHVAGKQYAGSH